MAGRVLTFGLRAALLLPLLLAGTAQAAPVAVSVTPSSGSGASQTFSLLYSDTNGVADIRFAYVLFHTQVSAASSCQAYYDNAYNAVYLRDDAGANFLGPLTVGQAGTLQNSQCTVDAGASSVSKSGNNLTVNLALSFKPAFAGTKNIYMYVTDRGGLASGWQTLGSWNTSAPVAPQAVSVTPNSGSGTSQTFSLRYSDGNGVADIRLAYVLFNTQVSAASSCQAYYDNATNAVYLRDDAGANFLGPLTIGQAGTVQNSQCTLDAGASSVAKSADSLTVNLALTFKPAFTGTKNIYMYVTDREGQASGWQARGSWITSAPVAPTTVSVTPSSGSGTSQIFSLRYSDGDGVADFRLAYVLFNTQVSAASSCQAYYDNASNAVYLRDDAGMSFLGPLTVGQAGTLQNSQCTLDTGASSVSKSGNNLTLNLAVSFKPAFTGTKNIYMYVTDREGMASGWQMRGSWNTGVPVAPQAVSVTPNAGAGTSQIFSLLYSDGNGVADFRMAYVLFNTQVSAASSCQAYYDNATNAVYLRDDAGMSFLGPLTVGQAGTLQNSQCTIDTGASSVAKSGNNLTLNLALSFKPAYTGTKNIYMYVTDREGQVSGWQGLGTWTGNYPLSSVSSISPTGVVATSGDTLLTVNGSSFVAQSVIEFAGLQLTTTYQSSTQLTATIPASMLQSPGVVPITVTTPAPGGGVSNAQNLTIADAVTVSPSPDTVAVNWTEQFTAAVSGEANQSVTWMVNDVAGGDATNGTITAAGIYIAPGSIPGNNVVTVKAVSVANANKYGTATVTLGLPPSDNYPRGDATSILDTAPALPQVPVQGTVVAVLDWTSKDSLLANDGVTAEAEVLAVCHNLSEMGIPHIHTTDWATASAYPLVAVAGVLGTNALTDTERNNLANYVQGGGTLLLWRTADAGLLSLLGVTASSTFSGTTVRPVTFNVPSADGVVRYIDDDVEVNWQMEYWSQGVTREYTVGSATAVATWSDGLAAIARSNLGTGRAYVFGWRLKSVLVDAELQLIPGAEPHWTNVLILDADIARLMVRGIYETLGGNPSARQFAPNGKHAALILTHDVDARVAYNNLPDYLALENTQGVKSTYLFTTAPYDSGWVEEMYNASGKANIQNALNQGFDVQSHSFAHYRDFDLAPYGTGNENANNYLPHYSADLGYTIGYSALGEMGVSRWLLRHDFNIEVPAFRSGYLLMPQNFLQALQDLGYRRDSTYAVGISRGFTPFVPFKMVNGVPTTFRFMEYPMGLEDPTNLDSTNVSQVVDTWEQVIRTNYKNNIPTVINVHPVNQPRLDALQQLFQRISDLDLWIGDWTTFANFWESQGVTCSRWP